MWENFLDKNFSDNEKIEISNAIEKEKEIIDRIKQKNSYFIMSLLDLKYIELLNLNIYSEVTKFFNYKDDDGNKINDLELLKLYLLKYRSMKYCFSSPELLKLQKIFMSENISSKNNNRKRRNKNTIRYDNIFSDNNLCISPINIEFKIFFVYPILNMFNKKIMRNAHYYDYGLNDNIDVYNQIFLDITETISLHTFIKHCLDMLDYIQQFKSINYIYYIQSYICSIKKLLSRNILFNKNDFQDDFEKLKFINDLLNKLKNFADIIYPMIFNILIINKDEIRNLKDNTFGITLKNNQISKNSKKGDNDYSQIYTWNIKTIKYDILKIMISLFHNFKYFYYKILEEIEQKRLKPNYINIWDNLKDIFNETFSSLLTKNLLQETMFVNSKIFKMINEINLLIFDNDNKRNRNNIIYENNSKKLLLQTYENDSSFFNLLSSFNNSLYKVIKDYKKKNVNEDFSQKIYSCHYYHCLKLRKDNMYKCIEYYFLEIVKNDLKLGKATYIDYEPEKSNRNEEEDDELTNNGIGKKKKEIKAENLKYKNYKEYLKNLYKNKIKKIIKNKKWSNSKLEVSNLEIKAILKYIFYICYINPLKLEFNIEANIILYLLIDILSISKNNSFCFDILYSHEIKTIIEYYPENTLILFKEIIKLITLKKKDDSFEIYIFKTNLLMDNIEILFSLLQLIFNKKFYAYKNVEIHIANNHDIDQSEACEDYVDDIFEGCFDKEFKKNLCSNLNKTKDFKFLNLFISLIKKLKNRVKKFHFNYLEKINYYIFSLLFKKEIIKITNNLIKLFSEEELNIYYQYLKIKNNEKKREFNKKSLAKSSHKSFKVSYWDKNINNKKQKVFKILNTLLKFQKEIFNDFNIFEAFSNLNTTKETILEQFADNNNKEEQYKYEYETKLNQYIDDLYDNYIEGIEILVNLKNSNILYYYIEFIFKLNIDLYTKRNDLRFNSEHLVNHSKYFELLKRTIEYLTKDDLIVIKNLIKNLNIEDNNQNSDIFKNFKSYWLKLNDNTNGKPDLNHILDEKEKKESINQGLDKKESLYKKFNTKESSIRLNEEDDEIDDDEDNNDKKDLEKEENEEENENNNLKGVKLNKIIMNFFENILFINKPLDLHNKIVEFLININTIDEFNFNDEIKDNSKSLNQSFNKEDFKIKMNEFKEINFEVKNDFIIIKSNLKVFDQIKDIFLSKRNFWNLKYYFEENENFNKDNNEFSLSLYKDNIHNLIKNKNSLDKNNFNISNFKKFIKYATEKDCINKTMESIWYLFIANTLDYDCFFLYTDIDLFKLIIIINELMERYDNINNNILNIFNKKSSINKHYFFEILANFIIFELKIISKYHYKENGKINNNKKSTNYIQEHIFRITTLFKFFQNLCEGNLKQFKDFVRKKSILKFFYNLLEYFITYEKIFEENRTMNINIIEGLLDVISEYISGPNIQNQLEMPNTILKEILLEIEKINTNLEENIDDSTNKLKIKISELLLAYIESNKKTSLKLKNSLNINKLYSDIFKSVLKIKADDKKNSIISNYNWFYSNKLQLIDSYCYSIGFKKKISLLINLVLLIKYLSKYCPELKVIEKQFENYDHLVWKDSQKDELNKYHDIDNDKNNIRNGKKKSTTVIKNKTVIGKNEHGEDIISTVVRNKVETLKRFTFVTSIEDYCKNILKISFHTNYIPTIYNFFKRIVSSIEVIDENGELLKIYFPKEPMTFYLTDNSKNVFFEESDLSSLKIKQIQIMKEFDLYYMEMNDESSKSKFYYVLSSIDSFYYYELFIYIFNFIINIWFLFDLQYNANNLELVNFSFTIDILNLITTIITFLFIILWFYSKLNIFYSIKLYEYKNYNDYKIDRLKKIQLFLQSIFLQTKLIPFLLHFIFGLLYYFNNFFLTIHLFMIIFFSKDMKYIIYGSMKHIDQFLLSLFLAVSIMNTYSIITLNYFVGQIDNQTNLCDNLIHCLFSILTYGLKGKAWSEVLSNVDNTNNSYYERFFFDLIFYLLIPIILFNIFTAILIDTFSQLKKESIERKEEWSKICFICGLDTTTLLKNKISFERHVKKDHNLWRYIYYLTHLKEKGSKEFSSVEYWVYECLEENNTNWIPNEITRKILKQNNTTEYGNIDYLEEIEHKIDKKLKLIKNNEYLSIKENILDYVMQKANKLNDIGLKNKINDLKNAKEKKELKKDDEEKENDIDEESEKDNNDTNNYEFTSNFEGSKILGFTTNNESLGRTKVNNSLYYSKAYQNSRIDFKKLDKIYSELVLKPIFNRNLENDFNKKKSLN